MCLLPQTSLVIPATLILSKLKIKMLPRKFCQGCILGHEQRHPGLSNKMYLPQHRLVFLHPASVNVRFNDATRSYRTGRRKPTHSYSFKNALGINGGLSYRRCHCSYAAPPCTLLVLPRSKGSI